MTSRDYLPTFLKEKYQELDEHPELNERCEKIADFLWLIKKIWCISSAHYQDWIWVKHETLEIVDSYDDTVMYFIEDTDRAIDARESGLIEMTDTQYHMLKKLYDMVESYDTNNNRPDEDKDIVNDPEWGEVRKYAKLVYKELVRE
ncbi:MAG: hypothetical protein KFB95_03130 [Simkaniaceae bacterium]|nr:MAG: hypothetical protein KFB95_03130 [Simkaniaceae bacterium]